MNNETKAENMLLDKKWTRKRLIDEVLRGQADNADLMAQRKEVSEKMSETIGDFENTSYQIRKTVKQYLFEEAIERACELIAEAHKVPELEQGFKEVNGERERLRHILDTTIEERTRAQEAVALVGATFNDYREANAADKMVSEYERIGEVEHWSIGSKDEATNWAARQCRKPI